MAMSEARPTPSIFLKTKKCRFFGMGMCTKGAACKFAHSAEEARPMPNLRCTKLCPVLLEKGECRKIGCTYAHAADERRRLGSLRSKQSAAPSAPQPQPDFLGTAVTLPHSADQLARGYARPRTRGCRGGRRTSRGQNANSEGSDVDVTASSIASRTKGSDGNASEGETCATQSTTDEGSHSVPTMEALPALPSFTCPHDLVKFLCVKNTFYTIDLPGSPRRGSLCRASSAPCLGSGGNDAVETPCAEKKMSLMADAQEFLRGYTPSTEAGSHDSFSRCVSAADAASFADSDDEGEVW